MKHGPSQDWEGAIPAVVLADGDATPRVLDRATDFGVPHLDDADEYENGELPPPRMLLWPS